MYMYDMSWALLTVFVAGLQNQAMLRGWTMVCVYQALFSIALLADIHAWLPPEALQALSGGKAGLPNLSFSVWAQEWAGEITPAS